MSSYVLRAGVPLQCPRKARAYKARLQEPKIIYAHGKEMFANFLKPVLLLIELFWQRKVCRSVPFSSSHERGFFIAPKAVGKPRDANRPNRSQCLLPNLKHEANTEPTLT